MTRADVRSPRRPLLHAETARINGFKPITAVVVDASGCLLVHKRMDGCPPFGIPDFAAAKALTCAGHPH